MKLPRVIVCAPDDWLADQLRESASERGWVVRVTRLPAAWVAAVADGGPCVALIQLDPHTDPHKPLAAVGELHRKRPDADVMTVFDVKLSDDDRPAWTAAALDLGARLVLHPPLTRTVLEDAVIGLMEARVGAVPPADDAPEIDLASGEYEEG